MADIVTGVLRWFAEEYFSEDFSGGDLLSLAVLVLLAFAIWTRRSQPNNIRTQDILALQAEVSEIKGAVNTLVKVLVPQGNVRSPLSKKDNVPPPPSSLAS